MTPSRRGYCSLLFLLVNPLSLSQTLDGLFQLTCHPSRALNLTSVLLSELQRFKVVLQVRPGFRREKLTRTLIVCLQKKFSTPLILKSQHERSELVTRPEFFLIILFHSLSRLCRSGSQGCPFLNLRSLHLRVTSSKALGESLPLSSYFSWT